MDAAAALADLVEISPQIEAAAVVAQDGELAGSVGVPEARAERPRDVRCGSCSTAPRRSGATRAASPSCTPSSPAETCSPWRGDERAIVAVARERATPGLVFYDLKRCLAAVAR